MSSNPAYLMPERREVRCQCGHVLFDRIIVRSRVVRVLPTGEVEAKCRCKRWLPLPLLYAEK